MMIQRAYENKNLVNEQFAIENDPVEIVVLPIDNGW